jgi:hypothetical protein
MKTQTLINTYGKNSAIESMCISIAFYRPTGSNPFQVNGIPVEDGRTLTIGQNVGDLDVSKYIITFQAGLGVNEAYVMRIVPEDLQSYLRS